MVSAKLFVTALLAVAMVALATEDRGEGNRPIRGELGNAASRPVTARRFGQGIHPLPDTLGLTTKQTKAFMAIRFKRDDFVDRLTRTLQKKHREFETSLHAILTPEQKDILKSVRAKKRRARLTLADKMMKYLPQVLDSDEREELKGIVRDLRQDGLAPEGGTSAKAMKNRTSQPSRRSPQRVGKGVRFVRGEVLTSEAQTLVNPVNCAGGMGSGLALAFRKRYPKMYDDYRRRCKQGQVQLGIPYLYKAEDGRCILNFPTKKHWQSRSKLADIESGMKYFSDHYHRWQIESVAFPALGCGSGGLNWSDVRPVMLKYLRNVDIPIEIYLPKKDRGDDVQ